MCTCLSSGSEKQEIQLPLMRKGLHTPLVILSTWNPGHSSKTPQNNRELQWRSRRKCAQRRNLYVNLPSQEHDKWSAAVEFSCIQGITESCITHSYCTWKCTKWKKKEIKKERGLMKKKINKTGLKTGYFKEESYSMCNMKRPACHSLDVELSRRSHANTQTNVMLWRQSQRCVSPIENRLRWSFPQLLKWQTEHQTLIYHQTLPWAQKIDLSSLGG